MELCQGDIMIFVSEVSRILCHALQHLKANCKVQIGVRGVCFTIKKRGTMSRSYV